MNKATKGAIAAGAAGILLAGGASTFALWEDSTSFDPAAISTGELAMTVGSGTWTDVTSGAPGSTINIGTFNIVPGDTLKYTTAVTVKAQGNNLEGELNVNAEDALAAAAAGATAITDYFTVGMTTDTASNPGITDDGTGHIEVINEGTYTVNVVITVAFAENAPLLANQNTSIDLAAIALKLEQS
ncbi:alternate-type signal peptide domain-containing protein [Arthrobacter sp. SA17]